jgi:hypothetical protein
MNYGQTFVVAITAKGAAFDGDPQREIADNLRAIAETLESQKLERGGPIIDSNGNTCGRVLVTDTDSVLILGKA